MSESVRYENFANTTSQEAVKGIIIIVFEKSSNFLFQLLYEPCYGIKSHRSRSQKSIRRKTR